MISRSCNRPAYGHKFSRQTVVGNVPCFEIVPKGARFESFMGNFKTHQNYSSKSACLFFWKIIAII